MSNISNKNSQYINSLVSYLNDTKPYHCKLTDVVEEYQFSDSFNVNFQEKTFTTVKIGPVLSSPFNFFSSGDPQYNSVPIKKLFSAGHTEFSSNIDLNHPGSIKAFRDEITDFAGMPFVYSKKSFDGIGISEVFVERNGDKTLREPLLEGHDYFQSHGGCQINIKQVLDANLSFEPLWCESRDDNVIFESFALTRRLANDYANPSSSIRRIEGLLVQMRTGLLNAIVSTPYDFNQFPFSSAPKEPGTNVPISGPLLEYTTTGLVLVDNLLAQIRVPQDYQALYNSAIADGVVIFPAFLTGYDLVVYLQARIANLSAGTISLLNGLLAILDSELLPRDYEELLIILTNGDPGDVSVLPIKFPTLPVPIIPGFEDWLGSNPLLHPFDSTPSSYDFWPWDEDPFGYDNGSRLVFDKFVDDQLSHLSPSIYFNVFTDFAQRHSGKPKFSDVTSPFIKITGVIANDLSSPGNSWRVIASSNSVSSYDVISGISGYIGSFVISGVLTTFSSSQVSFVATKISQPTIGQEVSIENANRLVINHGAPLETWDLIKVNPMSYTRPLLNSNRYGYIQDQDGIRHKVSLLNLMLVPQPTLSADIVLTARSGGQYFDISSPDISYVGLAQVDIPFNDGNLAFTIISGTAGPFQKGDKFYFRIENAAQPVQILDLSLGYGFDLDSFDAQELVYNNTNPLHPDYNRPVNFTFDTRFVDYDLSSLNVVATDDAVDGRKWRLSAIPNLLKPIITQKKDATSSNAIDLQDTLIGGDPLTAPLYAMLGGLTPDLKLYYADSFTIEWSDDNFNTVNSIGVIAVGGSYVDVIQGVSFSVLPGNKPFVAVESDDHISGVVSGGDVFSFTVSNIPSKIAEHTNGVVSSYAPRTVVHGDTFHETVSANWFVTFSSPTDFEVMGYLLEGNAGSLVPGTPLSASLSTSGLIVGEGQSFDLFGLGLTFYPGLYGFGAGDQITFTTSFKKPSVLVHGSVSGWQKSAIIGEPYWNGLIGFKINKPIAKLFNPITKNHLFTDIDNSIIPVAPPPPPVVQGHTTLLNVKYGNDPCQFVNVYIPIGSIKGVILRVHGGGWNSGNVLPYPSTVDEEPILIPVVETGYVVVDVNYRGINNSSGSLGNGIFPNNVNDVVTVLNYCTVSGAGANTTLDSRWQTLYEMIADKGFVVTGTSAGGHLALMGVCTYGVSSQVWPKAVEIIAGPFNLDYNNIFIDPLVKQSIIDPYINGGSLSDASPHFLYGSDISPGPWFAAINNSSCKFSFIHNDNDTLVSNGMARTSILNFVQFNTNASASFVAEGPPRADFNGLTPVTLLGNTPDNTTATLPTTGNALGDCWFANNQYWVFNNGTYAGDNNSPASVGGFTRWFDHNYLGQESDYIIAFGNNNFVVSLPPILNPIISALDNTWIFGNGSLTVARIRFDVPSLTYWLTPTPIGSLTPTGWIVNRSDIGVTGYLPLDGLFSDQYISILTSNMDPGNAMTLQLSIIADSIDWWNAQDSVILHPSINAKLPTNTDFVLIDKTTKDTLAFNLSYGSVLPTDVPSLSSLAPVSIDPRYINLSTGFSPISLKNTSPETEILNDWIPFTVKEYDSATSRAAFSDGATRIKLIAAGSGEEIGTVVQHGLEFPWSSQMEWDLDFFAKYLPLNSEANIVVYGSGLNEKLNVRISESLKFLISGGALTTDFQFNETIHIDVSEYHDWKITQFSDDLVNAEILDSPFGGFLPGYDNLPYDFETQIGDINLSGGGSYDVGTPLTDHFYEARQLAGLDPLNDFQLAQSQQWRDSRLAILLSQLSNFLNGSLQNTTFDFFLSQLDALSGPVAIATGFGLPARGLGIEINIQAGPRPEDNLVGAGVIDALVLGSFDPISPFDDDNFDTSEFDANGERIAILNTTFAPSIPAIIPVFTTYEDFETPLSVVGFNAQIFEFSFTITAGNLLAIQNMQKPEIFVWLPLASMPVQIPVVDKVGIGKYRVSLPYLSEAKFYIINP